MQKTGKCDRNEISDRAQSGTAAWLPRPGCPGGYGVGRVWRCGWHLGNPRSVVKLIRQEGALPAPFIHYDLLPAFVVIGIQTSSISMSGMG